MIHKNNFIKVFLSILSVFALIQANGQIQNRIIKPDKAELHGVRINKIKSALAYKLPGIDVHRLHKEDSIEKSHGKPFRFGKSIDIDIDFIKASTKYKSRDTTLMFYQFISKGAFSINLIFDKFFLAPNASLLIYNTDKSMVYGPIQKENNPSNGIFWSDLVKGESIILQLTIVGEDTRQTQIHVDKVIHGYKNTFAGFGESASCNRDIACQEGATWGNEGNSVAMLLLADGQRFCTGALLNDVCQDFTLNFLTAFHCLDSDQNGTLANTEQNQVNNWVFRFLYQSPTCGGGDGTTFQSINGSTFRSAFQQSDFALLLLNTMPAAGAVTYAGWSRDNVAATSAAAIHHPNGDVKKISIDNNALTNIAVTTTWGNNVQCQPNTHWNTIFDSPALGINASTVQHGSSGSPIFDQNHRIVGQLHGDHLYTGGNTFCDNVRGDYGRFDVSWGRDNNGNYLQGRNATNSLAPWLDTNNTGAITTNAAFLPSISIFSPLICTFGNTFAFANIPTGATVSWLATPSNLFSAPTGSFTFNPINSNTATLYAANSSMYGLATVTFTINSSCGNPAQLPPRTFWVGPPSISYVTFNGNNASVPEQLCYGQYNLFQAVLHPQYPDPINVSYSWSGTNVDIANNSSSQTWIKANGLVGSYATISVTISGACGAWDGHFTWVDREIINCGGGDETFSVYPNPASSSLSVQIDNSQSFSKRQAMDQPYQLVLINNFSETVYSVQSSDKNLQIPLDKIPNGVYYLNLIRKDGVLRKQIVVKK